MMMGSLPTTEDAREAMRRRALHDVQGLLQRWEEIEQSSSYAAYTRVPAWEQALYDRSVRRLRLTETHDSGPGGVPLEPPLAQVNLGQLDDAVSLRVMVRRARWVLSTYGAMVLFNASQGDQN
jgi:hypothetical protein